MCVLLFFITVFMRLVFIRRRNRFQQRLRLLTIRGRRRRTEAYFLHSQRKICRRRKVAWVLERPQFCFEHMLLNQYAGSLTDLEGSLNGKLFIFAEKKTTPWSQKFSEGVCKTRNTPEHPRNTPQHPRNTPGTPRNTPEQPRNTPGTSHNTPEHPRNSKEHPQNTKNSGQRSDCSRID